MLYSHIALRAVRRAGLLLLLALGLLLTPAAAVDRPVTPGRPASDGYFSLQPDPRLCPAPSCGGWFVALLNQERARCTTGGVHATCHVTDIDWSALGLDPAAVQQLELDAAAGRVIVRGALRHQPGG